MAVELIVDRTSLGVVRSHALRVVVEPDHRDVGRVRVYAKSQITPREVAELHTLAVTDAQVAAYQERETKRDREREIVCVCV